MTSTEFQTWVRYAVSVLPGLSEYMAKPATEEQRRDLLRAWHESLEEVSLDDAKAAAKAMMLGKIEMPQFPKDWPKCLPTILDFCAARRPTRPPRRFVDGQEVFTCPICMDQGRVTIWHPKSVDKCLNEGRAVGDPQTTYTCSVICTCQPPGAGSRMNRGGRVVFNPLRFDPEKHFQIPAGMMAARRDPTPFNEFLDSIDQRNGQVPFEEQTSFGFD